MTATLPLLIVLALGAQEKPRQTAQPPEAAKPDAVQSHYVLGPQDQLRITVFDEPDLTNSYRIEADGFITFPLINRVAAGGLTPAELQDRIRTQLASGYLKNPTVRVEIEQYKSQFVIVGGEVRSPGKIPMTGTMTLPEALAAAGSPTPAASTEVIVTHARKTGADGAPDKQPESVHVNLKKLQLGVSGQEIVLQDGDTIFVPKAQTFYINGLVRSAGQFIWEPGLTVQQAIALAGGLSERGSDRRIKVDRRMPDGTIKEISVELNSLVEPNDTVKISQRIF
jgi:polysaccharide biosynthesis/export protein